MRILAIITARGGSKRLPGKNLRLLGNKPLVIWSIDAVKNITDICDILVSTDDSTIASICKDAGAFVPWLRPAELATDETSSVDTVLHAVDWYESEKGKVDGILLLQPTSPFRRKATIRHGIKLFSKDTNQTVIGVSEVRDHPIWTLKIKNNYLVPFFQEYGFGLRSQDLPKAYVVNGSFYLISPVYLRKTRSFFGKKTIPLLIQSDKERIDIDTESDWKFAELYING